MGLFSSVLKIGSSLLGGGNKSAKAATKAAQIQADATKAGIAENARQFDLTRADQAPWLKAGSSALGDIGDLLGLNGAAAQGSSISGLEASPLFQSLFDNGQNAILSNAAATGGLRGGNIQSSLANFGRDTLSQVIQQQLANLGGLSGTGLQSAQNLGALGANMAASNANLLGQGAAAQAGGVLARQAISNNNTNNLLSGLGSLGNDLGLDSKFNNILKGLF